MTAGDGLPPIIDTHVHLDDRAFDSDREAVLAASRESGVAGFINIGYWPPSWETSRRLRDATQDVGIVLGLHPGHANSYSQELDRDLVRAIRELRPLAIGETGFDFSRPTPTFAEQERAFQRQLAIACEENLPVVIHQRAAGDALRTELDRWPDAPPIILHSFDGDRQLLDWALDRNCYIGIGGLATRPASAGLRALLAAAPPARLLLETDAPYLAPPNVPSRRNDPTNLPLIANILAPVWGLSAEELCWTTTSNASALFGTAFGPAVLAPRIGR